MEIKSRGFNTFIEVNSKPERPPDVIINLFSQDGVFRLPGSDFRRGDTYLLLIFALLVGV